MHIREATAQDALAISQIIARSWRGAYQNIIDPMYLSRLPEEYWLPAIRSWLSSGRMYGFIAETEARPVGCVIFGRSREEQHADWGEIVSLYVLPESMGNGVGSALLNAALAALHTDGYDRIYLWAIAEYTHGLRFYQHQGFHAVGEHTVYTLGSGNVTDVRLVKEMHHG